MTVFDLIAFALLFAPLVWEVWNDKDGDNHESRWLLARWLRVQSKTVDVWARCAIAVAVAGIDHLVFGKSFGAALAFSGALHFLFFDYAVAIVLKIDNWFEHLGEKSFVDNIRWWHDQDPATRLFIRLGVFVVTGTFYFVL